MLPYMARNLPRHFSKIPMLWIAGSFALGILISADFQLGILYASLAATLAAVASFIMRGMIGGTLFICIAFAFAGIVTSIAEVRSISPNRLGTLYDNGRLRSGSPVEIEGALAREPDSGPDGFSMIVAATALKTNDSTLEVSGKVRLFVRSDAPEGVAGLRYGSRIRVPTELLREDSFLNPGVTPRRQILDRAGIDATGSVPDVSRIQRLGESKWGSPLGPIYSWRANLIDELRRNLAPGPAGVMIASLLGNKNFLDRETGEVFREGGTFHILVISGLHITFIGGFIIVVMRRLTGDRRIQFVVSTSVLWAYTLAVGAEVPVVRAATMFTITLASYVLYRRSSLVNSLCFAALVLLVLRPSELFDASFQLTFVSVAAIVGLAYPAITNLRAIGTWTPSRETPFPPNVPFWLRRACEFIYWEPEKWRLDGRTRLWTGGIEKLRAKLTLGAISRAAIRYLVEGIQVSLIVQIAMLPLSVIYFHRVSVISVLLNLWVGIFIALESFAAVIAVVLGTISGPLAGGFYRLTELLNYLMLILPRALTDITFLSFRLPAYVANGRFWYAFFFIVTVCAGVILNKWDPFALKPLSANVRRLSVVTAAGILVAASIIIAHPLSSPTADGRLRVDFLDVGQGDSALVTFPDGQTLLIDGGGRMRYGDEGDFEPDVPRIGEMVVSEFLWHRGYSRIDHVLATHEDLDHIQGLSDVIRNFDVKTAIFGVGADPESPALKNFARTASSRGTALRTLAGGDVIDFGGVRVEVLNPPANGAIPRSDNDRSLVLKIVFGSRSILMTGDIERAAEQSMIAAGSELRSDVVKVPHHGSRTSSTDEFVNAVGADIAVISVGQRSQFGHPRPEVVDRWRAAGAKVLTTGTSGTITVSTDGSDLSVSAYVP